MVFFVFVLFPALRAFQFSVFSDICRFVFSDACFVRESVPCVPSHQIAFPGVLCLLPNHGTVLWLSRFSFLQEGKGGGRGGDWTLKTGGLWSRELGLET